ncbi:hypothetical protein FRC05_001351 [Tulasnella sp. 425]|nr:hypothetical protein FRC05_001351 [Tulasnella sp. 425]
MRPLETEHYLTNRSAGLPSYLHSQPLAIATTQEDMQKAIKAAKKKIARDVLNNAHSASNSPSGSDAGNLPPPGLPSQSVQITTTVGHQSSVQIVPLKRIHPAIGDEVGTTGLPPDSIAPPSDSSNTMTVSATQEDFEEDFVLPGDESEDETTPSGDMHSQEPRFSKKGAKWRREKLRTRSHCVLLKLYALEEGLADRARKCSTCLGIKETYQCSDCTHAPMLCASCITDVHRYMPFHRLRFWSVEEGRGAWGFTSLSTLGFVLYLGHNGFQCPRAPHNGIRTLQIFDINGQHEIPTLFCQCSELYHNQADQLLAVHLYPSSDDIPQTAFSFRLMKHFLLSQLEMCCSAASYYDMLALQTDNVNTRALKFLSCTREWKVIKTLMRANSKTGTDLKAGEATVKCGFCPIPGVNIPEDWKSDPDA